MSGGLAPNIADQADKLRLLQCEVLQDDPAHVPLVMCPQCGHTIMLPRDQSQGRCARDHMVDNPHYLDADNFPDADDDSIGWQWRRPQTSEAASPLRLVIVTSVYIAIILGALAALVMVRSKI